MSIEKTYQVPVELGEWGQYLTLDNVGTYLNDEHIRAMMVLHGFCGEVDPDLSYIRRPDIAIVDPRLAQFTIHQITAITVQRYTLERTPRAPRAGIKLAARIQPYHNTMMHKIATCGRLLESYIFKVRAIKERLITIDAFTKTKSVIEHR